MVYVNGDGRRGKVVVCSCVVVLADVVVAARSAGGSGMAFTSGMGSIWLVIVV